MKLCKDCKWFKVGPVEDTSRCTRNPTVNLISGEPRYEFAIVMREFGPCGKSAINFEKKG